MNDDGPSCCLHCDCMHLTEWNVRFCFLHEKPITKQESKSIPEWCLLYGRDDENT